jgi:flagellar hook protein FlgE
MTMRVSVTGLNASQTELSTIANNIANASTTGFKASRVQFADLFAGDASRATPGSGVRVESVTQIFRQGAMEVTGNNLDVAINGKGFFATQDADGRLGYTRSGNFRLNAGGDIVSDAGARVMFFARNADGSFNETQGGLVSIKGNAPLVVPRAAPEVGNDVYPLTRLEIDSAGIARATYANGSTAELGKLALANFTAPSELAQQGNNSWRPTLQSGEPTFAASGKGDRGQLETGALEGSTVDIAEQLVQMITAQRNFQANAKSITTFDAIAQAVINIR